jgi:hypothetical protein
MEITTLDEIMASENKQLKFTISPRNLKLLEKWSGFHGKTPGEFAGQIIASRLESDMELILKLDEAGKRLDGEPDHEISDIE